MTIGDQEQKTRLNKTTSIPTVRDIMAMFTESRRSKMTLELPWQPEERKEPFLLVIKPDKGNNFSVSLLSSPSGDVLFEKSTTDPGSIIDLLVQHRHAGASGGAPAKPQFTDASKLLPHQGGFDVQGDEDFVHPFLKMKGRNAEPELLTLEDEWQAPPKTMSEDDFELMEWEPAFEHVAPIQSSHHAHQPVQHAHQPQQPQIWDPNQSWNAQQQAAYWQQYQNAYGYPYGQWYGQYPQQQWFTQPPQQQWITQPLPPQQWVNSPYPQPYVVPEQPAPPMREPYVAPQTTPAAQSQSSAPAATTPTPAAPATPASAPTEPSKAPQVKPPANPALTTSGQFRAVGAVPQIKAPPTAPPGVPKPAEVSTEASTTKTEATEPAIKPAQDSQEESDRLSAVRPVKRPGATGTHSQVSATPKDEPAKAEAPKQDAPKQEAKPEQVKPEPAKAHPIETEAPKVEAPKPEPAKVDPVKVEAPKQEAPKQEAPKQEAPKQEAPKQEEPKQEVPKQEAPKQEAPKQEEPKQEAPKQEEPKQEAPKQETPKQETPKPATPPVTLPPASDEFALGSLLLIAGVIPAPALISALSLQNNKGDKFLGMKIGDILIRSQKVPNKTIEAALTLQKLARKGRVSKNKVGALLNQVHTTGRPVEELLELEWAARAKVNTGSVNYAERSRKVKELLGTFQRIVGDNAEVAEGAIDVLEKSGLVKRGDCDVGTMIDYAKRILIDETVDDITFQAAVECHKVLKSGSIKLEQAIIALLYCQRSRVSLNDAMRELGY